jgi:hypothetical protein
MLGIAAYSSIQVLGIVTSETFILITHLLVFLFGIQTGSIAFESRDAIENLIGEFTPILYADKTLPISPQTLVSTFIIKDVLFYAGFFFAPISIALGLATHSLLLIPMVFITITLLFCLGLTLTVFLISTGFKSISGLVTILLISIIGGIYVSPDISVLLDYSTISSPLSIGIITLVTTVLGTLGALLFEPPDNDSQRTSNNNSLALQFIKQYSDKDKSEPTQSAIYIKTLIDVFRSSGGIWKIVFSTGMVAVIAIFLITSLQSQLYITPHYLLLYVTILLMGSFTVYSFIHQVDDSNTYAIHPISPADFSKGKAMAFYTFVAGTVTVFSVPVIILYPVTGLEILLSAILTVGFTIYYYGLVYFFSGTSPTEFLFDTNKFTGFSVGVMIVGLPLLIVGLFGNLLYTLETLSFGVIIGSLLIGYIGMKLHAKAVIKWKTDFIP